VGAAAAAGLDDRQGQDGDDLVLVLSTEGSQKLAEALARELLKRRLVACVSLLPVRSLYLWQGALESAAEVKLLLKTRQGLLEPLRQALDVLHSYQTPEWIVLRGSTDGGYGRWLHAELSAPAQPMVGSDRGTQG
jgi:periplasmic divalent cation tolerance protein